MFRRGVYRRSSFIGRCSICPYARADGRSRRSRRARRPRRQCSEYSSHRRFAIFYMETRSEGDEGGPHAEGCSRRALRGQGTGTTTDTSTFRKPRVCVCSRSRPLTPRRRRGARAAVSGPPLSNAHTCPGFHGNRALLCSPCFSMVEFVATNATVAASEALRLRASALKVTNRLSREPNRRSSQPDPKAASKPLYNANHGRISHSAQASVHR